MEKFNYTINPNTVTVGESTLNEGDLLIRKFNPGTEDTYKCQLKFVEVENIDENTGEKTTSIKPFSVRVGNPDWIMEFDPEEYELNE